jgi:uncharacterized HAD superfamily protein
MPHDCHIYIDLDDVLCETAQALMRIAAREFGRRLVFERISSFNIGISFGLSSEEVDRTMRLMHAPDMLLSIQPIPWARQVIEQWTAAGLVIEIVTGRPPSTEEASIAWLKKHGIPYSHLLFVDKYGRQHPDGSNRRYIPLDELRKRPYRLAIDDSPEMAAFLAREMQTHVVLFDRPWNANTTLPASRTNRTVQRCRGWQEISPVAQACLRQAPAPRQISEPRSSSSRPPR